MARQHGARKITTTKHRLNDKVKQPKEITLQQQRKVKQRKKQHIFVLAMNQHGENTNGNENGNGGSAAKNQPVEALKNRLVIFQKLTSIEF